MNRYAVPLLISLSIRLAAAQSAHFDVASVKPSAPASTAPRSRSGTDPCPLKLTPHRLTVECSPMVRLISYAFRIPPYRVIGPDWLSNGQRFDIEATFPAAASASQAPEMLQALLKDRFGLTVHEATVDQEVFALVVDKTGLKVKPASTPDDIDYAQGATVLLGGIQTVKTEILNPDGTTTIVSTNPRIGVTRQTERANHVFHIEAPNITFEGLIDILGHVGLPMDLIDMTGLEGHYNVTLDFSLNDAFASAASIPVGADEAAARDPRSDMQNAILK